MSKYDYKLCPEKDYPWFLYDPLGNGFEYFKTEEERDAAAEDAVSAYCDEGWDEEVNNVVVGKATGQATQINVIRPGDPGWKEVEEFWGSGEFSYSCDYTIKPLDYVPEKQD